MTLPKLCLIPSLVALLMGCAPDAPQVCIDPTTQKRVDDVLCTSSTFTTGSEPGTPAAPGAPVAASAGGGSHSSGLFPAYYWFYLRPSGFVPPVGNLVDPSYGSYVPRGGTTYRSGLAP